jgi:hypothetical protein
MALALLVLLAACTNLPSLAAHGQPASQTATSK